MTWYRLFGDVVEMMSEPGLQSSLATGDTYERGLVRDAQAYETSLSGYLSRRIRFTWARRHEVSQRRPLAPELRPVTWQEQMQTPLTAT